MALSERQILNIIDVELQQSTGGSHSDSIESDRQAALGAYLGSADGREMEGRSAVTSTDVAEVIEWIMPELMKAFTQSNEVVTFDAIFEGDEDQAQIESEYVYSVLMKTNPGFLILHQFCKDALMQKNGFIKVFYDENSEISYETYTGLTEIEVNLVLMDQAVEVVQITTVQEDTDLPLTDMKVSRTKDTSKISVVSVPPEEFRVNKMHNSVDLSSARFTAHVVIKTAGELVEEGYEKEFVDSLPSYTDTDDRDYRFYMQGETTYPDRDVNVDPALRTIEVSECYMNVDLDEDGIAELVKIRVAGGDSPTHIIDIEPIDRIPFISATGILMSHKLFGLSIYDRIKEVQEQKTTLLRNILDNLYLQNNQRTIAVENQVNLDDLMTNRPGGIIRVKRPDALMPFVTPPLSADSYQMLDYYDKIRTARGGVTPEGAIQENLIGAQIGSEGLAKMMTQREELVGLIVRVIAETGLKPLCTMIRDLTIQHQDTVTDFKFQGSWVQISPSKWPERHNTTIRVGTGSGDKARQTAILTQLLTAQEKALGMPGQAMVKPENVFNLISDIAKFSGLSGISRYFIDPETEAGQQFAEEQGKKQAQAEEEDKMERTALAEAQVKLGEAELGKAKAANQNVMVKAEIEAAKHELAQVKLAHEAELASNKQNLDQATAVTDVAIAELKQDLEEARTALKQVQEDEDRKLKYHIAHLQYGQGENETDEQVKEEEE